eukprot:Em0011g593a
MELHRDQLQKRCRVCGSLLVAKGKKRRAFYQCSEFKECLFRAFSIDINNDLPDIHPVSLCYSCCPTTADIIIATIKGIAPPHHPPDMPLSTLNNSAILDQLQCLICLELLCQPLELPCRALKNIRIGDYDIHDCDAKPTKDEVKMASQVLSKLAATSPDKTISISTDGLVNEKKQSVQQMEKEIARQSNAVEKGFNKHEGPFVQGLDTALKSFKVKRQQYFGGVFVGNHIHKVLKPSNISIMCSSMIQVVHEKCPTLVDTVSATAEKFTTVFSLLGRWFLMSVRKDLCMQVPPCPSFFIHEPPQNDSRHPSSIDIESTDFEDNLETEDGKVCRRHQDQIRKQADEAYDTWTGDRSSTDVAAEDQEQDGDRAQDKQEALNEDVRGVAAHKAECRKHSSNDPKCQELVWGQQPVPQNVENTPAMMPGVRSWVSNILPEASVTAGSAAFVAEERKHRAKDAKCVELGWVSIPLAVETYGCWGTEAKWALSQLASRLATRQNCPKSTATAALYGRLSLTLVRVNVRTSFSRTMLDFN